MTKVKLYTKDVCPKCKIIKDVADAEGFELVLINIDENESAKNKLLDAGLMTLPVLEIGGELENNFNVIYDIVTGL